MPQKGDKQLNNFVGGLITEASDLSFPPNSSYEELNMDLIRNGSRERRLGLDYEDGYTLYDTGLTAEQIKSSRQRVFVWPTPSGFTEIEIGVVQIGTKLYFIDLFSASPSSAVLNGGSGLDASTVSSIIDPSTPFSFTIVNNNLIVVSEGLDTPFLLSYDYDTDTISTQTSRIKIRDMYGVSDGLAVDERPTTLSDTHKYNLRNQGWSSNIITKNGEEVLDETFNVIGVYPSNSDSWSLGKIADVTSADIDKYDAETLQRNSFDIGNAARGHFIIDLYDRGASREEESGIPQEKADREIGRISAVASFGGRLFYSGIRSRVLGKDRSPKLGGAVLFSQIARTNADLVKCYQEADPTSPNSSDLVDTDGGIIHITEAANIIEIKAIKSSIFAFAENGIWEIRGDEDGFRATSFQVNKISSVGVLARESIVEANGTIFFWGEEGIFTLSPNQLGTGYDTVNITIDSIQTAYNTIPPITKIGVKGYYDVSKNRIRWLFKSEESGVPIGVEDPAPPVVEFSVATIIDTTGSEPKVARLNNTTSIVIYKQGASTDLFYRILTLNEDLTVSVGSELTFVNVSPSTINGYDIVGLQDNKVLVTHSSSANTTYCTVGNWDGSLMTFGTPVSITTSLRPVLITNQLQLAKVNSGRVILAGRHVTNSRPAAIVVDIDGSDSITSGSLANSVTAANIAAPNIAMLSATKGVYSWNGPITTEMEVFTVTGTNITFNGTNYDFPNATQFPTASSMGLVNVDISKASASTIIAVGEGTVVISGVTTYAPIVFTVTESSGVLTSTSALLDTTHNNGASPSTTRYANVNTENGDNLVAFSTSDLPANKLWVTKYIGGTPSQEYDLEIEGYTGSDSGRTPDMTHLTSGRYILLSWNTSIGSKITAYGVSAT